MSSDVQTTANRITADELRHLLGPAAKDAVVEDSALEMMRYIDRRAVAAIGEALTERGRLTVARATGYVDPEDHEWRQVLMEVGQTEPGSDEWRCLLEECAATTQKAIDSHPRLEQEFSALWFDW